MYCPQCSQEQPSEDLRFCPRCGFPLAGVAAIVASNGVLPQTDVGGRTVWTRRNGLIFSLFWFMIFVLLFTSIFSAVGADGLATVTALVGTMGALIFLAASLLLLKHEPRASRLRSENAEPQFVKNLYQKPQAALPPEQSIPALTYLPRTGANRRDTNDLIQPSVTENTTKLLEKDRD